MQIIYPPLVEQAFQFIVSQGIDATKDELYKKMVEDGMLTETGNPTKKAIDQGIVAEYKQKHKTLSEFKKAYPIFENYETSEFTQQAGIWYVSQKVIDDIHSILKRNDCDIDTLNQIKTYFGYRNYDYPHGSIPETKGVYHPLYTPYDDSMFRIVDGLVTIPKEVMADILYRCEIGELEVDPDTVEGFKNLLESMEDFK
ncbi:hypothetical protein D922_01240 [Enterococcus faecalis 06-MB-DW-09]|nr:hypothetical protein D922_01240 [Enterococcus faecalis 06-MB-DW-09]